MAAATHPTARSPRGGDPAAPHPAVAARRAVVAAVLCLMALVPAFAEKASEYEIKAAFVYGVMKFATWRDPGPAGQPVAVAVLGTSAGEEMGRVLAGRQVGGRSIVVRRYARASDVAPAAVLFVAAEAAAETHEALRAVAGRSVLTIVEGTSPPLPAVILLDVVATRLVFDVDLDAGASQGVQLGSNLLGLARRVQGARSRKEPLS